MDHFLRANQQHWDELVPIHAKSRFYDLAGFKAGATSLMRVEREEMVDVAGKSLLHLQCHFGMDTLSWARLGAHVTGADFSEPAIALARALGAELGIEARFVCANLYDLPDVLDDRFDVVYTSYGVLCWLPDLTRWARIVAHYLRPGGLFYIVEQHPLIDIFDDEKDTVDLRVAYPYFHKAEPLEWVSDGSYADAEARIEHQATFEWIHPMGDIVNALISAGLRIDFLHEFPFLEYERFPFMERGADGYWRIQGREQSVPLLFSLKATHDER
jgi:SAM-dependent methyltransferase